MSSFKWYSKTVPKEGFEAISVNLLCDFLNAPQRQMFDKTLTPFVVKFQKENGLQPDGICGPVTWKKLLEVSNIRNLSFVKDALLPSAFSFDNKTASGKTWNAYGALLDLLADLLGVDRLALLAVIVVESSGKPFGLDGRPIVRFENHIFWNQWGKSNPEKFNEHFMFGKEHDGSPRPDGKKWLGHWFRKTKSDVWRQMHVDSSQKTQDLEWEVLETASLLAGDPAIMSASFGLSQIVGFNFKQAGYSSPKTFMSDMNSEKWQLVAMVEFIKNDVRMLSALRKLDFVAFAKVYNGPGQPAVYGERMKKVFNEASKLGI